MTDMLDDNQPRAFLSSDELRAVQLPEVKKGGLDHNVVFEIINRAALTIDELANALTRSDEQRSGAIAQSDAAEAALTDAKVELARIKSAPPVPAPVAQEEPPAAKATRLLTAASATADQLVHDAREEAERIVESARAATAELRDAAEAERAHLAEEMTARRRDLEEDLDALRTRVIAERDTLETTLSSWRAQVELRREQITESVSGILSAITETVQTTAHHLTPSVVDLPEKTETASSAPAPLVLEAAPLPDPHSSASSVTSDYSTGHNGVPGADDMPASEEVGDQSGDHFDPFTHAGDASEIVTDVVDNILSGGASSSDTDDEDTGVLEVTDVDEEAMVQEDEDLPEDELADEVSSARPFDAPADFPPPAPGTSFTSPASFPPPTTAPVELDSDGDQIAHALETEPLPQNVAPPVPRNSFSFPPPEGEPIE